MKKQELHTYIEKHQSNITQITAYKQGMRVYSDEWHGYTQEDTCHVMSATKSISALLIGIAIDRGYIQDIQQAILDFFPDYKVKRGEKTIQKVTIQHLLTMTTPYKYRYEPWTKICSQADWTYAALDFVGGRKGLTNEFRYSTLGIHILHGILANTTGMTTVDFANTYLFEPIGVAAHENYYAQTAEEHKHFITGKEPKRNVWFCDGKGVGAAGYGLCLSAQDMAKIGQLCLDKGRHDGKQIISEEWLKRITSKYTTTGKEFNFMPYGYLWWIIEGDKHAYAAIGNSGNVIYVNHTDNIVVGITAYFKPTVFDRIEFIQQVLEPYIMGL